MAVIEVNRNPSHRELNQFGFIWLGFFLLVAVGLWLKLHSPVVSIALAAIAVVVPVVGWAVPSFMRVVYVGLSYLACRSASWSPTSCWAPYTTCW